MSTTDEQVPVARTAGDLDRERRFAACFDRHYPRVVGYGLRRLPDLAAAEDAAAEVFLIAWRRFEDAPSDPLPWLLAIARNVIRNESRSVRRRDRLVAMVAAERAVSDVRRVAVSNHDGGDGSATDATVVRGALERLSDRDREVLLLTSWDGLDASRAAAVLGCSRGTFAVRLHRARTRFARALRLPSACEPSTAEESR
jgi:RNA polymerase sigma-70 factor, ECF subfamily